MKKAIFLQILVVAVVAIIASGSLLYVAMRRGTGNRALLTMRSGFIKMRRGLREFGQGLKWYASKGMKKYEDEIEQKYQEGREQLMQAQEELQEQREQKKLEKEDEISQELKPAMVDQVVEERGEFFNSLDELVDVPEQERGINQKGVE